MIFGRDLVFQFLQIISCLLTIVNSYSDITPTLPRYSVPLTGCDGGRFAEYDVAGRVTFRSAHVLGTYTDLTRCDFIISPRQMETNNTQVMFYFTHFRLEGYCTDMNVTVYDGKRSIIKGLGDTLCGYNRTLENRVFTSTENEIRVVIRWNNIDRTNTDSSFELVFVSFYEGVCITENNTFSCSNDRCISSKYSCRDDLNYCGNGSDPKCVDYSAYQTLVSNMIQIARQIFFVLGILVGIILIKKVFYDRLRAEHGSILNIPVIRKILHPCETSRRQRQQRRQRQHSNTDTCRHVSINNEEMVILTNVPPSNTNTINAAVDFVGPPSYEEVTRNINDYTPSTGLTQTHSAVPYTPAGASSELQPPSYDEVIANSNK